MHLMLPYSGLPRPAGGPWRDAPRPGRRGPCPARPPRPRPDTSRSPRRHSHCAWPCPCQRAQRPGSRQPRRARPACPRPGRQLPAAADASTAGDIPARMWRGDQGVPEMAGTRRVLVSVPRPAADGRPPADGLHVAADRRGVEARDGAADPEAGLQPRPLPEIGGAPYENAACVTERSEGVGLPAGIIQPESHGAVCREQAELVAQVVGMCMCSPFVDRQSLLKRFVRFRSSGRSVPARSRLRCDLRQGQTGSSRD